MIILDHQFLSTAKKLIHTASRNIDIITFKAEITTRTRGRHLLDFFNQIAAKARSGVVVRILLNWNSDKRSVAKTNLYVMQELKAHNVQIRYLKNNRCCHAKIILVDNEKAILGSHNLSVRSCHNNFEISYLTQNKKEAEEISTIFDQSFYDAQKW
jgi:phosphatidylserine/phosphatidylglycerophosphate/cardiolipin synthase-like enzyme